MTEKTVPFDLRTIQKIAETYPTPFHIYDERGIRRTIRELYDAFAWVPGGFLNYYAVKALPNPYILEIVKQEGMGSDCSSLPELMLSESVGITGEKIMFSSNDTPAKEYAKAYELGAIINLDDISHIPFLERHVGIPELICFRYNPGPLKQGNAIIGNPEEAKYGLTRAQLFDAYRTMRDKGVRRFGLHTMVASNELNADYFIETADILFDLAVELSKSLDIRFEFVNLGGGVGIPYRPEQAAVDMHYVSAGIKRSYERKIAANGLDPLRIVMECGRMVTGPHGYLVSGVLHTKDTYKKYIGVDSCMANLMRPGMYGAYHHITVMGKEKAAPDRVYDVSGSLCENNDKFAIDRSLPEIEVGDLLVIHDTGAHGYAMGFNYNGKLRSAELLLKEDGSVQQIRRAETVDDYFATLDYPGLG
ncbi:MAG TPA: diaminopimelate decarboxylase [Spirochaetia bacterium]|nr:diaminopimelate decarboxylase [Spirochaetia bacterium]